MPAAKTLKRYGLITVACALYALAVSYTHLTLPTTSRV